MAKKKKVEKATVPEGSSVAMIKAAARLDFGDQLIKTLDEKPIKSIQGISWGSPSINYICTGDPFVGIVTGRVYEILGLESSGKTTVCLHAVAEAQKEKLVVAFIDMEHTLDMRYAINLGIDKTKLLFTQPDYGEQALSVVERFVELGVSLIVVDSVAALVPKAEYEGLMGDSHMGLMARMMGQALRKLTSKVAKSGSSVIFINQLRMKIGLVFGNPEVTPGGNALKYHASIRMRTSLSIAKDKAIKGASNTLVGGKDQERLGSIMKIAIPKNKVHNPFGECEIPIYYGLGIDIIGDWYDFAARFEIIEKGKGAYNIPQGKGKKALRVGKDKLSDHVELVKKLVKEKWKR